MSIDGWRERLSEAIVRSGHSERHISLAARPKPPSKPNLGPGYVHSILKEGKDPTIGNLQAVCEAAGISIYYVLGGFDLTPEAEKFLRLWINSEPEVRESLANLLSARPSSPKTQSPSSE